jgi:phosphoribosylglycinamide formyltransferase-1
MQSSESKISGSVSRICIFASGAGTNAREIIRYFRVHPLIRVVLLASNKPEAGAVKIAQQENVPVLLLEKERFFQGNGYLDELSREGIDFIVLAGFLWKIPELLLSAYPEKIINIHPALLPKFGGKGMFGLRVHQAVIDAGEKESGITIHLANDEYDQGKILFQARCPIEPGETPQSLASKLQKFEHTYFPPVVEQWIELKNKVKR